jgi:hypothetical protein
LPRQISFGVVALKAIGGIAYHNRPDNSRFLSTALSLKFEITPIQYCALLNCRENDQLLALKQAIAHVVVGPCAGAHAGCPTDVVGDGV